MSIEIREQARQFLAGHALTAEQLATQIGVMLVTDLQHACGQPLVHSPRFAAWAESVKDLVLFERR